MTLSTRESADSSGVGKPRLRAAEALLAGAVALTLEERRDRLRVAVS